MRVVFEELRQALRVMGKRPGLAVTTALTLGLGIGLTATMFSVVYGSIWRGLPVEHSDRVVHLARAFAARPDADPAVPLHDFLDWRARQSSFEDLAAFYQTQVSVGGTTGGPQRYGAAYVTANLFDLLGVPPALGRGFTAHDDRPGAARVAIVGHRVWRDHFGGQPALESLTIRIDSEAVPVVGVMPERFRFPYNEDVWLALRADPSAIARGQGVGLQVVGRLKDGVSLAQAHAELSAVAKALAREYPATNEGVGAVVRPYVVDFFGQAAVTIFYTFFGATIGVLVIACVNVANLLLATTAMRTREIAVRSTLGASRSRLMLQMLIEVLVLAGLGGLVGLLLARAGIRLFNDEFTRSTPPFWMDIRLDAAALVFVFGLAVVVSLVAGLVPAVRASGGRAVEILKDESRGGSGWRVGRLNRALVIVEIALSSLLLVGAGLLVRSVVNVSATDFGFEMDRVVTGGVALPASAYPDAVRQRQFWDHLRARLEQQPGVRSVTLTSNLPGVGSGRVAVAIEGQTYPSGRDYPAVRGITIAPRFFETFSVALRQGRDFGTGDVSGRQMVAIVDTTFAERFLGGPGALGRRVRVMTGGADALVTIVGVAAHLRFGGVRDRDPETIFLPLDQWGGPVMRMAVRTHGDPLSLAMPVRDAVATLDPDLPVYELRTMAAAVEAMTWFYGTFATAFVAFGAAALLLAMVGLYSLMACSVGQRTREIGIRMAMGADAGDVWRLMMGQALAQLGVGLIAGVIMAAYGSQLLSALLVGVQPRDSGVYMLIVLTLLAAGLLAVTGPAIRAARTNPTDALRRE